MSDGRMILPVLLGFERKDDTLAVVVDTDPESTAPDVESILTLQFAGCAVTGHAQVELGEAESALAEGIGRSFDWIVAGNTAEFYIDHGAIWGGFTFSSRSDVSELPSLSLVHRRVSRLAEQTDMLTQRFWTLDSQHDALTQALEREAEREIDRAARKLPFLRQRGSASTAAVEARAAAFERVKQVVCQSQKHRSESSDSVPKVE